MAMPSESYGQDEQTTAVSPEQELDQLRAEHRRLFDENGKRRAELLAMLRTDSERLHYDNREMESFRQWLIDVRPRDVPVPIEEAFAVKYRAEAETPDAANKHQNAYSYRV